MKRNYNLKLTVESCQDLKKRIKGLKDDLNKINKPYIKTCLEWIKNRSIEILNEKDTFYPSNISDVRDKIRIDTIEYNKKYALVYYSEVVGWIEFGTGIVGKQDPHPLANVKNGIKYSYASGKKSGTGDGSWDWYNKQYGIGFKGFKGYKGKRFIYEAFQDFIDEKQYIKIYQKLQKDILDKYF